MAKILITGVTGFVGSYICKKLVEDRHKVVGLMLEKFSTFSNLDYYGIKKDIDIAQGDLTVLETLSPIVSKYHPDVILHFGAQAIVKTAQENPVRTFRINALGTLNMLEVVRLHHPSIQLFLQMSTDKVFGSKEAAKEDTPYSVTCPYSASKIAAENICKAYRFTYGLPISIIRSCNLYGPADFNRRVIPNTIEQMLTEKKVIIYKGDDKRYREYIHVEDLYSAIMFIMKHNGISLEPHHGDFTTQNNKTSKFTDINISPSTGRIYSTEKIVKLLASVYHKVTGDKVSIDNIKREEFVEISKQSLDGSDLLNLGWKLKYFELSEGLTATVKWHINNPDYFEKIRYR